MDGTLTHASTLTRPITVAVLAIGGQGGGVLVDWIVALVEREGWQAQSTSVPGVAQRTGATVYYVEAIAALPGQVPVFSAMAAPGDVDVVIAAEWMEAGRAMQRGLVTPDRTTLIASTHRAFAVSEKEMPGDGTADPGAVTRAAQAASRRFVAFDMAALAEQAGSVISSVLFGALCGAAVLPFGRDAFEATISEAGIGVQASLRGFALGFDAARTPPQAAPTAAPPDLPSMLKPVGHAPYDALLARAAMLPPAAHEMLAEGLRHVVGYQDVAYGAAYLDAVESVASAVMTGDLAQTAAKYIARAMVYDDVIRVATLKTQPSRTARVRHEMAAKSGQLIATTEFMHPRMEELLGLLPPGLGEAVERRPRLVASLDRVICGPRRIRTDTVTGFLMLYAAAGLRGWRRRTLRHARESARIEAWLSTVRAVAPHDPALAAELLTNQRLIKGYSETHARGLDKYARVMAAAERLRGRSDAAVWVRRLREAALKDEQGAALEEALRTVDSFLDERTAA
ncbi:indolepyruvate oxidoreductase subunit beta family protein [Rhodopila sp.]|uniref:indolepyruvate oxidoreductase subunit beta family protein n=1 Tax=Rhodopila sp. TaxID=2480087 RepID=UPI003D0B11FA